MACPSKIRIFPALKKNGKIKAAYIKDNHKPIRIYRLARINSPALDEDATRGWTAKENPAPNKKNTKKYAFPKTNAAKAGTEYQPIIIVSVMPSATLAR